MKKKKEISERDQDWNGLTANSTLSKGTTLEFNKGIEPLQLNSNLGREELNAEFKKVEDKINEIIKKIN